MIGPHCYGHLTPTMEILRTILFEKKPVDIQFHINFVAIDDVVNGMITAAEKGRAGERYILGNEFPVSTTAIFEIAKSISNTVKVPPKGPKPLLLVLALLMELAGRMNAKQPELTRDMVHTYYQDTHTLDLSTSANDLGYQPSDPLAAIKAAMEDLHRTVLGGIGVDTM